MFHNREIFWYQHHPLATVAQTAERRIVMDKYISRAAVFDEIQFQREYAASMNDSSVIDTCDAILHNLSKTETADVQPVKHGRWIENSDPGQNINEHYMCSECGCTFHNWANDNFCPNCGVRMDGDKDA